MANVQMGKGKFDGIQACANDKGVISAAAMDQRGSLMKAIGKAAGSEATAEQLSEFKTAVTRNLTPHASAILMDPEYGLDAIKARADNTGVLLAYEKSGYDTSTEGRLPDLLDDYSVRRLVEAGADAIKILLYYNPVDKNQDVTELKHAFIERIGAECMALDVPFFLEPLVYDDDIDGKSLEFARKKPEYVTKTMAEFTKPRYGVDVLKVEVPVTMEFVEGTETFGGGEAAYTRQEAMEHFRNAASVATKPFIYLSAGVTDEAFRETLELAAESETAFSGVLCGRATWQDGVAIYGEKGVEALDEWLQDRGVKNIQALNEVLEKGAKPWWTIYGGKENIEIV